MSAESSPVHPGEDREATRGYTRYAPAVGPARWLLVAGRRFVACVESTVSDSIVDAVWWLAESDLATIESVVGAFPLSGPDSVRSFAVAELGEPTAAGELVITAVVRGSAGIDVFSIGGARRFSAGGVQPWVLAEFRSVIGLVIGGGELPTGPAARLAVGSLPIRLGVVDGEMLTWTLSPIERSERSAAPDTGERRARTPDPAAADEDETIIRGRSNGSGVFGHPPAVEAQDAPPVGTEPPRAAETGSDGVGSASLAYPHRESLFPPTEPVVLPPPPATFAVRLPSGEAVTLDLPVLVGRRPTRPRLGPPIALRLEPVLSPSQQVSGTHVRVEQSGDAVVVTDLRSTNGTVVVRPDGASTRLRPGESVVALVGTMIEIGDGNIIEIIAAPAGDPRGSARAEAADRREEGRE